MLIFDADDANLTIDRVYRIFVLFGILIIIDVISSIVICATPMISGCHLLKFLSSENYKFLKILEFKFYSHFFFDL